MTSIIPNVTDTINGEMTLSAIDSNYCRRRTLCKEAINKDESYDTDTSTSSENVNVRRLFTINEIPLYLAFNKYIRSGYRGELASLQKCFQSIFWLTNETVNIWSHLFGCFLFMGMLLYDLFLLNFHASLPDKLIVGGLLLCFQGCMITSATYHTFNCCSKEHFYQLLKYDLLGISFSLLAVYLSGIYYAYWCDWRWCIFYSVTVAAIFVIVLISQMNAEKENLMVIAFVLWALYGIIPTIHWVFLMGGWYNPIVHKFLPRVVNMYMISSLAFLIYITSIPERFFPGRFDYFFSSHQIWHCLVVFALYYWHNTGIYYVEYRMNYSCRPAIY